MTFAVRWLRRCEHAYIVFNDATSGDRYVQFATDLTAAISVAAAATIASAQTVVAAAARVDSRADTRDVAGPVRSGLSRMPYYGEPDHEPLKMEVGSGLWRGSIPPAAAHDPVIVAALNALGLPLGGPHGTCRNFCRPNVTEPSDILADVCDHILAQVLGAGSRYRLVIKRGHFSKLVHQP